MKQLIPALLAALCLLLASCGPANVATLPMGTEDPRRKAPRPVDRPVGADRRTDAEGETPSQTC